MRCMIFEMGYWKTFMRARCISGVLEAFGTKGSGWERVDEEYRL
jgi:hypothetical protein